MAKRLAPKQIRRKLVNTLPNIPIFPIVLSHILLSPYTKVEESFNLHSVHDVLAYPFTSDGFSQWDHHVFPGAVPRSFLPSIILGLITYPISVVCVAIGLIQTKIEVQILARMVLGAIHCITYNHLSKTIRARYGTLTRRWFLILSLTQFHIPYYASRTLPNFIALPFVYLFISLILRTTASTSLPIRVTRLRKAIIVLTATATVTRLEIALFLLPVVCSLLFTRRVSIVGAFTSGLIGGLGALVISGPIDLYLWSSTLAHPSFPFTSPYQLIWPEISALHYNLILGKSSNWGVSPWWYYLVVGIPKVSLASFPLAALGLVWWLGRKLRLWGNQKVKQGVGELIGLFGPGMVALVGATSFVGHKEWRFVIYVVPILNVLASITVASFWETAAPHLKPLFRLGIIGLVLINIVFTLLSTFISSYNYPGGSIMQVLEALHSSNHTKSSTDTAVSLARPPFSVNPEWTPVNNTVYLGNYALQSGASLFTFSHDHSTISSYAFPLPRGDSPWRYLKDSDSINNGHHVGGGGGRMDRPSKAALLNVKYLITDNWVEFEGWHGDGVEYTVVGDVQGVKVRRGGTFRVGLEWKRTLALVQRRLV